MSEINSIAQNVCKNLVTKVLTPPQSLNWTHQVTFIDQWPEKSLILHLGKTKT